MRMYWLWHVWLKFEREEGLAAYRDELYTLNAFPEQASLLQWRPDIDFSTFHPCSVL
jgi:hypothetical protein